jgi:hypothetical protein
MPHPPGASTTSIPALLKAGIAQAAEHQLQTTQTHGQTYEWQEQTAQVPGIAWVKEWLAQSEHYYKGNNRLSAHVTLPQ